MSNYVNPKPVIVDKPVAKKIVLEFTFPKYVTKEQAAEGITNLIKENGRVSPDWCSLRDATYSVDESELQQE